jgi:hypothetical protein
MNIPHLWVLIEKCTLYVVICLPKDCSYEWAQKFKYGFQKQDNAVWPDQVYPIVTVGSAVKAEYLIREYPK